MKHHHLSSLLNQDPIPKLQQIEVSSSFQIPSFQIVGLASQEIHEAKERVRSAIEASGLEFPRRRITLNLSPASVRKQGTGSDLAMALAILKTEHPADTQLSMEGVAWAELGLDGRLKCPGQILRAVYAAWAGGKPWIMVSKDAELRARSSLRWIETSGLMKRAAPIPLLFSAETLVEAWSQLLQGGDSALVVDLETQNAPPARNAAPLGPTQLLPLNPIVERAVSLSAAGAHHLLLLGPRGTGKSHALTWLTELVPPVDPVGSIFRALAEELWDPLAEPTASAPVRRVSSQVRPATLLGSAQSGSPRPGEFALAHGGLLVADEFPEWPRDSREALREPLETAQVILSRVGGHAVFPARFTFAATGNLCPCGGALDPEAALPCRCSATTLERYRQRLSGPILDRTDIVLRVDSFIPATEARNADARLEILRQRVFETRLWCNRTWGNLPTVLPARSLQEILDGSQQKPEINSIQALATLRSRHKAARLALTLAAWNRREQPTNEDWLEAMSYRPERLGWM